MVIFPPCKINLGLSVLEKRPDGFHNLETVLYPLPMKDALDIVPSNEGFRFDTSGIPLAGDPRDNLVVRAWQLLDKNYRIGPVHIHLHKAIPAGAGLGGGSADAAGTLVLLNELFALGLSAGRLEGMAGELGSDCAFFIQNTPRLAIGRGDRFQPVNIDLTGYAILLVKPDIHINTALAYSWIMPSRKQKPLAEIITLPVDQWNGRLINDFEIPVFGRHPELSEIKKKMLGKGALYASLTGTGSAVFGIFGERDLETGPDDFPGCFTWHS